MLQIASILMVIGAIVLILGFVSIYLLAPLASVGMQTSASILFAVIGLIGALLQLVSGILGFRYWSTPSKAKICLMAGLLTLLFALANNIFSIVSAISNAYLSIFYEISSIISGLFIPLLFLFSAFQLYHKKASVLKAEPTPAPVSSPMFIPIPEAVSLPKPEATSTPHNASGSPASNTSESAPPPSV